MTLLTPIGLAVSYFPSSIREVEAVSKVKLRVGLKMQTLTMRGTECHMPLSP